MLVMLGAGMETTPKLKPLALINSKLTRCASMATAPDAIRNSTRPSIEPFEIGVKSTTPGLEAVQELSGAFHGPADLRLKDPVRSPNVEDVDVPGKVA
jgi:hypothetical protein